MASSFESQTYCLRRSEAQLNMLLDSCRAMFDEEELFDCTIVCEGKLIKGHKLLLAAASQYFKSAFTSFNNPCQNTAVIIREVPYLDLKTIIDFIYRGEVLVEENQISSLQKSVEALKVNCLYSQTLQTTQAAPKNFIPTTTGQHYYQRIQPQTQPQTQPQRQQPANPYQSYYPSLYQATGGSQVKVVTSQTLPSCIVYKPHEPFIQLKELLRRETPVNVCHKSSDNRSVGHISDAEDQNSISDQEYEIDIPKAIDGREEDVYNESKNSESNDKSDNDACSSLECQEEQVIDMSVNSNYLNSKSDELNGKGYTTPKLKSDSQINIESGELGEPLVTITSKSLPLSVTIPSSVSSTTARAIAASTTLAVASGLLTNSGNSAEDSESSPNLQINESESSSNQSIPLKRGRGRPPRYSRDEREEVKTYKVRPILPSSSSSVQTPGIIISSEPSAAKRGRPNLEALMIKGRKTSVGSSTVETNGKNMCPYCPQVYYSTQAMNDHINNVHTRNSHKYICEMCSKEFSWKISLTKHLRNTHKPQKSENNNEEEVLLL
ncbi:protein tramtrack: beta isoform-like protein [Dinothrombium tinctorium]|uniref:Protein tramtrack: beta isoform-like protein n=1 Tax=Dinothrombium tinctorium TaxID=1965070 RepID=A0A3S3RMC9_9ACAR|nr:protein tramtrack: beta isoform-like protein [Dinothrombium tinctorium]